MLTQTRPVTHAQLSPHTFQKPKVCGLLVAEVELSAAEQCSLETFELGLTFKLSIML